MFKSTATEKQIIEFLSYLSEESFHNAVVDFFKKPNQKNEIDALISLDRDYSSDVVISDALRIDALNILLDVNLAKKNKLSIQTDFEKKYVANVKWFTHQVSADFSDRLFDFCQPLLNGFEKDAIAADEFKSYQELIGLVQAVGYACANQALVDDCTSRVKRLECQVFIDSHWYPRVRLKLGRYEGNVPSCFVAFLFGNDDMTSNLPDGALAYLPICADTGYSESSAANRLLFFVEDTSDPYYLPSTESMVKIARLCIGKKITKSIGDEIYRPEVDWPEHNLSNIRSYIREHVIHTIPALVNHFPILFKGCEQIVCGYALLNYCDPGKIAVDKEMFQVKENEYLDSENAFHHIAFAYANAFATNRFYGSRDLTLKRCIEIAANFGVLSENLDANLSKNLNESAISFLVKNLFVQSLAAALDCGYNPQKIEDVAFSLLNQNDDVKKKEQYMEIVEMARSKKAQKIASTTLGEIFSYFKIGM